MSVATAPAVAEADDGAMVPAPADPAQRGMLLISDNAVRRLVLGTIERTGPSVTDPEVSVRSNSPSGVDLDVAVSLEYPTSPLSGVLAELRSSVVDEIQPLLGRPVRRFDLRVSHFVVKSAPTRRRVL